MRIIKSFLIVIYFLFSLSAKAEIKIINWNESIHLTDNGKRSEVTLTAKASGLPEGYYHNSFSFIFDPAQNITIEGVRFNSSNARYTFQGNQLQINFNKHQGNGDKFSMSFSYKEVYNRFHQYLRREAIYIPSWAAGADAKVNINFEYSLESATLNNRVQKIGNKFIYSGTVPESGVMEIVKLTPSRDVWDVVIKNSISSYRSLGDLNAVIPVHFENGGQRSENYRTVSRPVAKFQNIQGNHNVLQFYGITENKIDIESKARIYTGKAYRLGINRNPSDYLEVSPSDRAYLSNVLQQIKNDPQNQDLPLYAKIGRFVNKYIQYNSALVGRRLDVKQIIEGRSGVCTEYSKLYNVLARMAGIPSVVVSGVALGEYDRFEGHSWNLIYNRNQWVYVDPTWNLMSGVVSSSHIYFCDDDCQAMSVSFPAGNGHVNLSNEFNVIKVW